MIKSLLGDDETTKKPEEDAKAPSDHIKSDSIGSSDEPKTESVNTPIKADSQAVKPFEVVEPIGKPKSAAREPKPVKSDESFLELVSRSEEKSAPIPEVENNDSAVESIPALEEKTSKDATTADGDQINISPKTFTPESAPETIRKSGLAYSAAIVLFASVVFMMLIGWFVDFNFGTQPWGIVGGIVLGSIIGFVQFFRTTAQILRPPKSDVEKHSLFSIESDKK